MTEPRHTSDRGTSGRSAPRDLESAGQAEWTKACPDRRVWDILERLTEEVPLVWAERDRDPIFDRLKDFH